MTQRSVGARNPRGSAGSASASWDITAGDTSEASGKKRGSEEVSGFTGCNAWLATTSVITSCCQFTWNGILSVFGQVHTHCQFIHMRTIEEHGIHHSEPNYQDIKVKELE